MGLKLMVDQYYIIVNHVIYGLIVKLVFGYTLMERSIMGKLSKDETLDLMDEMIKNLRQCDEGDDCRKCPDRKECLRNTRNVLSWVLEVFSIKMKGKNDFEGYI